MQHKYKTLIFSKCSPSFVWKEIVGTGPNVQMCEVWVSDGREGHFIHSWRWAGSRGAALWPMGLVKLCHPLSEKGTSWCNLWRYQQKLCEGFELVPWCLIKDIILCFLQTVIPCTHHAPLPFKILFGPVIIFGLAVWPGTAQACLPLGYADASSHCSMRSHHNWAARFELDATIWLHQIREDLCFYSSGLRLVGRVFALPPETNLKNRTSSVWWIFINISHLMLVSASVLPSYMGAHGHFSLKPSKCFGIALRPEIGWQVCLDAAVIGVIYCHMGGTLWTNWPMPE